MPASMLKFSEDDNGIELESFSDDEAKSLERVITNTKSNIFAWRLGEDLTPEQVGALLSRYSRTVLTGKRLFLKEFLPNKSRGREFFESWLIDYGDDSIQEMAGGLPMSCEFVSNLAVKEIEDNRMGSYIEKSSRYVFFDKKLPNGEYMFYKDPDILSSRFGDEYLSLMHSLFDSYTGNLQRMSDYIKSENPFDNQSFRIGDISVKASELTDEMSEKYGISVDDLKKSYDNAVKANALDFMRDYLPMATLTHVGVSANARVYDGMINKMLASPLAESRWVAKSMLAELNKLVPSLTKRIGEKHGSDYRDFLSSRSKEIREHLSWFETQPIKSQNSVDLIEYAGKGAANPDLEAQIMLSGAILYRFLDGISFTDALDKAAKIKQEERLEIIRKYTGVRGNRRHRVGRAFENLDYLFDLKGRIGIYRDLQRHRIGTQERQNFTTILGYDTRKEFDAIGISDDYKSKMAQVADLYTKLNETLPYQAQYVVTYGFYTRWYYRVNARQLFHFCELRSTPSGHPDYRKIAQDMYTKVREMHPTVASYMNFVNMDDKQLGRLESEIRIAVKRKALSV